MVAPVIVAALAPVLTKLAQNGMDLIGSAILSKGKDVVEKELGVKIDEKSLDDPATVQILQTAQMEHEEKLIALALEDRKVDLEYYKQEVVDTDSARKREIAIATSDNAGWLNQNLVPILALIVILGGGYILMFTSETDLRIAVVSMMTMVLGYYFGKSSSEWRKDRDIQRLAQSAQEK